MRPGQQNKRGRGRNNNNNSNSGNMNRKGSNPLTRTYDSSGPDVKIRGTAQHIAEKYSQLGRDAQSSGDRVVAENYLQHAEHYNRIIASAQAQMQERYQRDERAEQADRGGDDSAGAESQTSGGGEEAPRHEPQTFDGSGPQPVIEGTPAEVSLGEETPVKPSGDQPKPRRPRRQPRRSQKETDGEAASGNEAEPTVLAEAGE
jgi:hypothetical protein